MNTGTHVVHGAIASLAASLAFALLVTACDRREAASTPVATHGPEPSGPGDAAAPAAGAPTVDAGTTSQADALALLLTVNEHGIAAADQALTKQVTGPVLAFAEMMKTEHGSNLTDTTRLGGAASTAPAVTALRESGEASLQALAAHTGAGYEQAYIDAMVKAHAEALALIDGTLLPAATADNVRRHFTATRATEARHLERAKEVQGAHK